MAAVRQKDIVTVETRRRYYIYGKGYNSELEAYMQMAKRQLSSEFWEYCRTVPHHWSETEALRREWYAAHFPATEGCECSFCTNLGEKPNTNGCWVARMAYYRSTARKIIKEIRAGKRNLDGSVTLALPPLPGQTTDTPEVPTNA